MMHLMTNSHHWMLAITSDDILGIIFVALWLLVAWAGKATKKMEKKKPMILPHEKPATGTTKRRTPPRPMARPAQRRPVDFSPASKTTPDNSDAYSLIHGPLVPPVKPFEPLKPLPQEQVELKQIRDWSVSAPVVQHRNATARKAQPTVANSVHQWMQPKSLRAQYILTELFQPPLALRDQPNEPMR